MTSAPRCLRRQCHFGNDERRLRDILQAIGYVDRYTPLGRAEFDRYELVQIWMVHSIQTIGEAARSLSAAFRDEHPEIPWRQITAMRHILVHRYFGIDLNEVWRVVEDDPPELRAQLEMPVNEMASDDEPGR